MFLKVSTCTTLYVSFHANSQTFFYNSIRLIPIGTMMFQYFKGVLVWAAITKYHSLGGF